LLSLQQMPPQNDDPACSASRLWDECFSNGKRPVTFKGKNGKQYVVEAFGGPGIVAVQATSTTPRRFRHRLTLGFRFLVVPS